MPAPHYRRDQNTALTIEQCDENTELFDTRTTSNTALGTAALNKANSVESIAQTALDASETAVTTAGQAATNATQALSTAEDALNVANNHSHESGDISFESSKVAPGSVALQSSANTLDTLNTYRFEALSGDTSAYSGKIYRDGGQIDPLDWTQVGAFGLIEAFEVSGIISHGYEAFDSLIFSAGAFRFYDKGRTEQDIDGLYMFRGPNGIMEYRDVDKIYTPQTDTDTTDLTLTETNQSVCSITTTDDIAEGDYLFSFYAVSDTPGQIVIDFKQGATVRKSVTIDIDKSRLVALSGDLSEVVDALTLSSGAVLSVEARAVDDTANIVFQGSTAETTLFRVNNITSKIQLSGVATFAGRDGIVVPIAGDYSSFYSALGHTHPTSEVTGLDAALASKAPISSPTFTGTPSAPTASSGTNTTQLATTEFVQTSAGTTTPVGAVAAFARGSAPTGWLKANGAAISRTTYAALFAAIGTNFGAGDGSTTFNIPDLRGEFVRGWDDARGVDSGRVFASAQTDQNAAHNHTGTTSSDSHSHTGTAASAGAHEHNVAAGGTGAIDYGLNMNAPTVFGGRDSDVSTSFTGNHTHSVTTNSDSHSHTLNINNDGGTEARPRNVALLYCIKY